MYIKQQSTALSFRKLIVAITDSGKLGSSLDLSTTEQNGPLRRFRVNWVSSNSTLELYNFLWTIVKWTVLQQNMHNFCTKVNTNIYHFSFTQKHNLFSIPSSLKFMNDNKLTTKNSKIKQFIQQPHEETKTIHFNV